MSKPRVGFLGTGWIGRHRMEAMAATGAIDPAFLCDPDPACLEAAQAIAPSASIVPSLEAMLSERPDGVVIATPSAQHAAQAIAALEAGAHVFCQKPLGRSGEEVAAVAEAARRNRRLLHADFSYRETAAVRAIKALIGEGALGDIFAIDAEFHNAYGPDKPWFYDTAQSGGGCLIDLGVHLVDMALHLTGFPPIDDVRSSLWLRGAPAARDQAEDFVLAELRSGQILAIRIGCSWKSHAGKDADIRLTVHGTEGGASMQNVDGSFYDFVAERHQGTRAERIAEPPDAWGGRAAANWAMALGAAASPGGEVEQYLEVARLLDAIYAAG